MYAKTGGGDALLWPPLNGIWAMSILMEYFRSEILANTIMAYCIMWTAWTHGLDWHYLKLNVCQFSCCVLDTCLLSLMADENLLHG